MPVYKREYSREGKPTWYYQFFHDGRKHVKAGFRSQKDAKQAERARLRELTSKRSRPLKTEQVTFEAWLPRFLEQRRSARKSPRTVENERRRGNVLCRRFGKRLLRDVTTADILEYVESRSEAGLSSRAINLELTFLRTFFKYAVQRGYLRYNPAREVTDLPPEDDDEVWIPTDEEFMRFMKAAAETPTAKYLVPWLWTLAYTGARPSEALFLEWGDLDFGSRTVTIRPKNGNPLKRRRRRKVPMKEELAAVLTEFRTEWERLMETHFRRYPQAERHDWVFIQPRNHSGRARSYSKSFQMARGEAGLPRMVRYTMRHYFASMCIMSGTPLLTVARWMGHKNTKMVEETYGHLLDRYMQEEMRKVRIVPESKPEDGE